MLHRWCICLWNYELYGSNEIICLPDLYPTVHKVSSQSRGVTVTKYGQIQPWITVRQLVISSLDCEAACSRLAELESCFQSCLCAVWNLPRFVVVKCLTLLSPYRAAFLCLEVFTLPLFGGPFLLWWNYLEVNLCAPFSLPAVLYGEATCLLSNPWSSCWYHLMVHCELVCWMTSWMNSNLLQLWQCCFFVIIFYLNEFFEML